MFAPHPHDAAFGMGGSLLLASRQGIDTRLVALMDDALGGQGDDGLASWREKEARTAAQRLGIQELQFWRLSGGELKATPALIERISDLVQRTDPVTVFLPSPMEPHPEHRATAFLVWNGLRRAGFSGTRSAYEISIQGHINSLIDITAVLPEKHAVMGLYRSQITGNDYPGVVLALNKARSYTLPEPVTHAEGFHVYGDRGPDLTEHTRSAPQPQQSAAALESAHDRLAQSPRQLHEQNNQATFDRRQLKEIQSRLKTAERRLQTQRNQLHTLKRQLDTRTEQLTLAKHEIHSLSTTVQNLENSTSWKITKPLRAVITGLRNLRHGVPARGAQNEGQRATTPAQPVQRLGDARSAAIANLWGELSFPAPNDPRISVIMPVQSVYPHTFNCLKSIAEDRCDIPFELIAVEDHADAETVAALAAVTGLKRCRNENSQGLAHATAAGVKQARGQYLVFLGSDTIVSRGWLKALLQTFEDWPDAGMVGVKILYPYHTLKEAGSIVWADGSSSSYGRGDGPGKPQYNYARATDCCSAACLAIPRTLFQALADHDEDVTTADVWPIDLAFRVRAAGKQVLYQPGVTIVQFDAQPGDKIVTEMSPPSTLDRSEITQRWRDLLLSHGMPDRVLELAKDRDIHARVLVVELGMITPDQDSGSLRMARMLEIMRSLGIKVTFAASNLELQAPYGTRLQQQGIEVLYAPFTRSVNRYLEENGRHLDVVILSRLNVAAQFLDLVRAHAPAALLVFDTVDLHFLREGRKADVDGDSHLADLAAAIRKKELELMEKADLTLVVSAVEKAIIAEHKPDLPVELLSNIHEIHGSEADFDERQGVLFIGGFNHPPNTDAVLYYVQEILPRVENELGKIKTFIVGSNPPGEISDLASDTIIVTGYVPELAPYLTRCRLSVAPLRYGAGVKGKINTAMSYGVPVVATSLAVEGMYLKHGQDVLVGDDPESFARSVVRLYRDAELWRRLSENGLRNIEQYFSRKAAKKALINIFGHQGITL